MAQAIVQQDILFEVRDILGRKIRTTKKYKKKGTLIWPKQKK